MWTTVVLLVALAWAAWTDARCGMIYNATTYPGIVLGLAAQGVDGGWEGIADGVRGFLVCGGVILFIFLFGGTGGGDVKLIAMLGAGLGLHDGIEAMLWTFILGAVSALGLIVWQLGAVRILREAWRHLRACCIARRWLPLTPSERAPLQRTMFLAPAALVATLLTRGDDLAAWWQRTAGG